MADNPEYTGYDVGCKLVKYFPGYGWFGGTIKEIRLGAAQNKTRRIKYSDGDEEDLSIEEIQRARKSYARKLSQDRKKDNTDGRHVSPFPSSENSQMLPCNDNATAAVTQEPFPNEITPSNSLRQPDIFIQQQQSTARRSSSRRRSVTFESLDMPTPTQIDTAGLSDDYEITRAQNVERNQNRLLSLGLISESEANAAIDAAWKRTSANDITPNSALPSSTSNRRSSSRRRGIVSQSRDTEITPSSDSTLPSSSTTTSSSTASRSSSSRRRGVLANDEDAAATSLLSLRNQETFNPYSLPARPSSRVTTSGYIPSIKRKNNEMDLWFPRGKEQKTVKEAEDESDHTNMDSSSKESDQEDSNVDWVQCDDCDKWRKLSRHLSAEERNDDWFCDMNPDRSRASCDDPEEVFDNEDEDELLALDDSAFPNVLYKILQDNQYPGIISWTDDGNGFAIPDQDRFLNEVYIPIHGRSITFSALLSKLRKWGFFWKKGTYYHKDFQKGNQGITKYAKSTKNQNFAEALYEILENNEYPDIISWTDDGKAIVIHNQERFMNEIYPSKLGTPLTTSWTAFHQNMKSHGFKWKGKLGRPPAGTKVKQFFLHKDFQRGRNQATSNYRKVEPQILWTQCELCDKWHEVPSFLPEKNLPKEFHCSMNFWNSEYSKCDAEEPAREGAIEDSNREDDTSEGQDEEEDTSNSQDEENEDVIENQIVDEEVDNRDMEETTNDDEEEAEEQVLTTFPNQLYEILENNEYPDIISWTDDGTAFIVKDQKRFLNEIYVPKFAYWKDHDYTKFTSVESRMHRWGICNYTKLTDGMKVFFSKDFRKGYQGILHTSQVRRRRINAPTKKRNAAEIAKLVNEPKFTMEAVKRRVRLIIEQNPELLPSNRGNNVIYVWFTRTACFVSESNECYFNNTFPEDIAFLFRVPRSAKEGIAQGPPFLLSEKQPWAWQCTFDGVESSKFHKRLLNTTYIRNELGQRSFVVHQGFSRVNARNIENFLQKQLSQREFGTEILWRAFDWGNFKYQEGDENKLFTVGVTVLDASEVKKRLEKGEIVINGYKHPMNQSDDKIYF